MTAGGNSFRNAILHIR